MVEKIRYFATGIWAQKHVVETVTQAMIAVHIGLSMAVIAGGISRFPIPSYQPLIDYTGGRIWIWGVWIGISGVLMATPRRWPNILGLWLGMFWHIIWMACFGIAVINYPDAAATPVPAYAGFAWICTALLTARVTEPKKE